MKKTPIILNVDTGVDDAVAIGMALFSKKFDIKLITCGFGNVEPLQVMINTRNLLGFWKQKVPVVVGSDRPLKRPKRKLVNVHGVTGLGNYQFPKRMYKVNYNYLDEMKKVCDKSEEKITIISLTPLTNIAHFLLKYPECKSKIKEIVFMSGSLEIPDTGVPYMEFNGAADPESCEVIISSGVPLLMCPMEMGHTAYLDYADVVKTKYMNKSGAMLEEMYRSYKDRHVKNGIATHDGCAIACIVDPKMFKIENVHLFVKYYEETKTGVILCDFENPDKNARICTYVNVKRFKKLYFKTLKRMN